jgi:hypothetical protein
MPVHGAAGMWRSYRLGCHGLGCHGAVVFSILLLCHAHGLAQSLPQPPCGQDPVPPYPGVERSPIVKFWSEAEFGHDWIPAPCTGWTEAGFSTLTTTVARFRYTAGAEGLLRQIGAASELAGMRYWSTTHKQWQTLIVGAHALTGPQLSRRRQDFTPGELTEGKLFYFEQADNLSGTTIYSLHITQASVNRLVFEVENVSTMRYFLVTLFHPGEMQSIYFLDHESEVVWRYYSIVRTGRNASRLAAGHEASSINRAVAFYRSLVGVPTDQEPPAAR